MSQSTPDDGAVERFRSAAQRSSTFIVIGVLFSIPAIITVYLITPRAVGFLLIAATGMVSHVALRSLDPERAPDVEGDLSDFTKLELIIFFILILSSIVIGISVKLWAASGLGYILALSSGNSLLGIFAALAFPIADRKLADIRWYLSLSTIASVGVISIIILILRAVNLINHMSGDTLTENSRRFSI